MIATTAYIELTRLASQFDQDFTTVLESNHLADSLNPVGGHQENLIRRLIRRWPMIFGTFVASPANVSQCLRDFSFNMDGGLDPDLA